MKTNIAANDQWWTTLSAGEKELIRALMRMVQGAKHSEIVEVSRAARKWESGLSFFFKSRLKNQRSRRIYLPNTRPVKTVNQITSFPSNGHNQQGVSPNQR